MTTYLAVAAFKAGAGLPPPPPRHICDFLPVVRTGEEHFSGCADRWAQVVFQVLWYMPEQPQEVVLLGEAFAPPMSTLGSSFSSFRLPLYQFGRRLPQGAKAFENFRDEHLARQIASIWQFQKSRKARPHSARSTKVRRLMAKPEMMPSFSALKNANESKPIGRVRLSGGLYASPKRAEQITAPVSMNSNSTTSASDTTQIFARRDVSEMLKELPAAFHGACCIDVDFAWNVPTHPKDSTEGYDGVLSFRLRQLRVPPCDFGCVRIRICEVEAALPFQFAEQAQQSPSETGDCILTARPSQWQPPVLPPTRPLWASPSATLGSQGQGGITECTSSWPADVGCGDLKIATRHEILRLVRQDLLRDRVGARSVTPSGPERYGPRVHVGYDWAPLHLPASAPMPRMMELLKATALLDAKNLDFAIEEAGLVHKAHILCPAPPTTPQRSSSTRPRCRCA